MSARCSYFRDLLASCPGYGARICLELRSSPVDVALFSSLLRYLYTGDFCTHDPNIDLGLLRRLGEDFGTPNPLEHDLRYLLETGDYADAALIFTAEGADYHRPDSGSSEYGFRPKLELPCHKAILSARSPFFRNMIQRRMRAEDHPERVIHVPTRIILDESVIPKRYARVLLHAIYLDAVDLSLILRGTGCGNGVGSLGEVQALTHTGRTRPSPLEEAMELYQIGKFLDLDILAQGCEDLILEFLTLDTISTVLKWSNQPHGSEWVYRQTCHYLREEFSAIVGSPVLHQLDKSQFIEALQSNFLQASELEVLQAVLTWGEQELVRRMEDREPNLLSHTAHSVTRKGIKKRDLSDVELREILSELLPHVRMDHVLPPNNEVLNQAIRRGLVSTPPSHMIGDDRENLRINAWIRGGKNQGLFVRPRLFMPYYEEVKALLEDHMESQQIELLRMRRSRHLPDIHLPDITVSRLGASSSVPNVSEISNAAAIPPLDATTLAAMQKREQKLRQSPICQRAMSLPLSSRHEINRQLRLRVVREFNLPDDVADFLENGACYCGSEDTASNKGIDGSGMPSNSSSSNIQPMEQGSAPPSPVLEPPNLAICYALPPHGGGGGIGGGSNNRNNLTFPRQPGGTIGTLGSRVGGMMGMTGRKSDLPALIVEGEAAFRLAEPGEASSCSEGHLSDIMPDVAMATASLRSLAIEAQAEAQHESLQLDLGDGPGHAVGGGAAGGLGLGMQVKFFH